MTIRTYGASEGREYLIATGIDRLDVLDRFGLTGVATIDGIRRVRSWDVRADRDLRYGRLLVEPTLAAVRIREEGDLVLLLAAAQHRAQARRALRAKVLETVHTLGLPVRPFVRPAPTGVAR